MLEPESEDRRIPEMLLGQNPGCHWAVDRQQRFAHVSGDPLPLFRKSAAELLGRALGEALGEDVARTWGGRMERALAGESFLVRERAGEERYSVQCFPLRSPEGEVRFAAGFALNVTALSAAEQELRTTALRMFQTQQSERGRLARFLHDEVGQCLSAAGLQLDLLRMDFAQTCPGLAARTAELQHMLEQVMAGVRDFSYELNPELVERSGLYAALDRLVGRSRKEFSGTLRLMADSSLRFPPEVGSALYQICQEALQNAIQHSGCSLIELIIKSTRNGPALEVRDNGRGFDPADPGGSYRGLGFLVMEHWAAQAQIRLSITSEHGQGTVVRAIWEGQPA